MSKKRIGLLALLVILFTAAGAASAQDGPPVPPTIIRFTCSLDAITMAETEAGDVEALFEWQTVGLTDTHRVVLSAYRLNGWVPVITADTILPASGSYGLAVQHPVTFGSPTYMLSVADAAGHVVDQRVIVIPYASTDDAPQIDNFSSSVQTLESGAVSSGAARVTVGWRVTNRQPYTNLVFEQVFADGRAVTVELPRSNLWVPSSGEGVVAPVLPGTGQPVRLRLRVVDLIDGTTLDERSLPPIPLVGALPTPTPLPTIPPPATAAAMAVTPGTSNLQIVSFAATPSTVARGGTVTVNWQVIGATQVAVWLLDPDGRLSVSAPESGLTGAWTVVLGEQYTSAANFQLFASDALGNSLQSGAMVQIQCMLTYFFGQAQGSACPAAEAQRVQAAYQVYEHGFMVWRADSSEIFVLYANGQLGHYRDSWRGEYFTFESGAPSGLIHPQRGFGKVWMENPVVREGLGWATAPEQGYTMTYQRSGDLRYSRLYLTLPSGAVIYIVENSWGLETG